MEELLSLKWNNHRSTFIHVLGILRDKQLYTDATIACEGKFYSVHKLVLSTCSDYFSAMLDRTNCKNPVIVLKDIKSEDLEALLDYMYLGEVNVRQSDLATLIKAAECLRVKGLAVPDDEPAPTTSKKIVRENLSRRSETSSSPPPKRKRRSDLDDGRDDVRNVKPDIRHSSPPHSSNSKPKSPVNNLASIPLSPVINTSSQLRLESSPSKPQDDLTNTNTSSTENNLQNFSDQPEPYVKVEMDDGGHDVETYDISNDGAFKEEGDENNDGGGSADSGGDISNDLPEFLQQAASAPLQGGAFSHSSFSGSTSFQPGDIAGWQGDGSNVNFPQLNFSSSEGSSQQNAPGMVGDSSYGKQKVAIELLSWEGGVEATDILNRNVALNQINTVNRDSDYVCSFCAKTFTTKTHLDRHFRIHTGEKPFGCHLCSYKANQKGSVKRHLFMIHHIQPKLSDPELRH